MIINIRGTNGSGKTTLVRKLLGENPFPLDLIWYDAPTKRDPARRLPVEGYAGRDHEFLAVGSYKQGCGGMDTIPSFDLQQQAVYKATDWLQGQRTRHILCEGVLASTVAGSWLEFFRGAQMGDFPVLVAYLDTPLEVCLERIRERQRASGRGEREIKAELVADKIKSIAATRPKFEAAGIRTVMLDWERPVAGVLAALQEHSHG